MLEKTVLAGVLGVALSSAVGLVHAADAAGDAPGNAPATAPAPTPEHTLTGNIGVFSQYIFRGLTQTDKDPALQGGFDYSHRSGFYVGTWASNISWLKENASAQTAAGPLITGTYQQ